MIRESVSIPYLLDLAFADFDKRSIEFHNNGVIVEYDDKMQQKHVGSWYVLQDSIYYEIKE